jgi:hypothetical protein
MEEANYCGRKDLAFPDLDAHADQGQEQPRSIIWVLFNTACRLRDLGYHEAAIITAQTACEGCTEQVMTDTFDIREFRYLLSRAGRRPPSKLQPGQRQGT